MSDLQRTRVHCFRAVLEENFAFHLFFGCSVRLERGLGTSESLLVTREATPSGGNSGQKKVSLEAIPAKSIATQLGFDADCRCAPILRVSAGPGKTVHARFRVSQQDHVPGFEKARPDARAWREGWRPAGEQ